MKKYKNILACLCAAVICFASGCDNSEAEVTDITAEITSAEITTAETTTTETSAETTEQVTETETETEPDVTEIVSEFYEEIDDVDMSIKAEDMAVVIGAKLMTAEYFDFDGDGLTEALVMYQNEDGSVPLYYFDSENADNFDTLDGAIQFDNYVMNGKHFVACVLYGVNGGASPAACYTVVDGKPVCVGNGKWNFSDESKLLLCSDGSFLGERVNGYSSGDCNFVPVYWDGTKLKAYELTESDMDFVKKADVNNIVGDMPDVKNVLLRSNGLVHINYYAEPDDFYNWRIGEGDYIKSRNFIIKDGKITSELNLDWTEEYDTTYGWYNNFLEVEQ